MMWIHSYSDQNHQEVGNVKQKGSRKTGSVEKLVCPRVNDDQKIDVHDQKLNSGRPHDYWIFKSFLFIILLISPFFYCITALRT